MDNQYKISLGIDLDTSDLQSQVNDIKPIDIKVDAETKELTKTINEALKSLSSGSKNVLTLDTSKLEDSLADVTAAIKEIKASIGSLDTGSGMKSLVGSINSISTALDKASNKFDELFRDLKSLSGKDFSLNFGINMGGSNPIGRNAAYGQKARGETLPQLKQQMNALVKYYNDTYKKNFNEVEVLTKLITGTKLGTGNVFQNLFYGENSMLSRMGDKSLSAQMQAYKEYIDLFKQASKLKGLDISSVTSQFSKSADQLVQDAVDIQTGAKEMDESFEKLKQIFSGGNSLNVENLIAQLDPITVKLEEIKVAIQDLSKGVSIEGLTSSFEKLSDAINSLVSNATLFKNALGDGLGNVANIDTGVANKIEQASDAATASVVQDEKKKQEAYKATADAVIYHAGVISKLNKAETNGRFYGSNRGTGYYGTGHYFVDSATKHELDNSSYSKLPYTSVDISQYDNLFKATTDEIADGLHTFLRNLTRFTQGADDFDVSELFAQFKNVFGDTIMDIKEFGSRLDQLKAFMSKSDLYDRSDSVSTQFMKSLGYEGVDTRGTKYADTTYGTVIYDLKEESILQANITDELQKQGQMLEKINYAKGQAFDKGEDERIQGILDAQAKRQEIIEEFEKSFDSTNLEKANKDLVNVENRIQEIDEIINNLQYTLNNLDQEYKEFSREMSMLGFDDDDLLLWEDEDEWKKNKSESYNDYINTLSQEKAELQSKISVLEEAYNKESQLSNEAYERARKTVEQRRLESQQSQETANAIEQLADARQNMARVDSSSDAENDFKEMAIAAGNTEDVIDSLKKELSSLNINFQGADTVTKDLQDMNLEIQKVTARINGNDLEVSIKGIETTEDGLNKVVTATKRYEGAIEDASDVSRTITQTFETSADAAKKLEKETKESFNTLKSMAQQMGQYDIEIAHLEADGEIEKANSLKRVLDDLEKEYNGLEGATNLTEAQTKELEQVFVDTGDSVRKFKDKLKSNVETQELTSDFNKLKSIAKEIATLKIDILKSDDADEIVDLTTKLDNLEKEYNDIFVKTNGKLSFSQLEDLKTIAKNGEEAFDKMAKKIAEVRAELAQGIKVDLEVGKYDNQLSQMYEKFDKLSNAGTDLYNSVKKVEGAYNELDLAIKSGDEERIIQAQKEYAKALEATNNQLRIQAREENKANRQQKLEDDRDLFQIDIDNWLKKNSAAAKQFGDTMSRLRDSAENCDRVQLNHLINEFKQADRQADKLGLKTEKLTDRIKSKFKEYSAYFSVAEVFMYAEQALRDMFEQVKLVDTAMTELKKVTDESDASYNKFLSNAASRSREIGTTIDGLVTSTADFARLGYNFTESQGLAEVANIYSVVGDEIEGVEGATESLISTMEAFKDTTSGISNDDFAMDIVDKFNEVSNNFAISSGGIGEAMQRSASSLRAANNTIDESIALITAANTVVQDPTVVGTSFKTISMRIRGAKTELEEAGLETEGMVESTAKLREEILALTGVDIMLDKDNFKSTYQIMDELAQKWQDLTDIQQASVTELIAGKRQGNVVSSLMQNFDIARDALQTSLGSDGSAMAEHEKWMNSIEAKLQTLKSSWQSFSLTFLNSDSLKGGIDALKTLVDILEGLIDNFGILGTIGLGAGVTGVVKYFKFINSDGVKAKKTITDVVDAINNIGSAISNAGGAVEATGDIVEAVGDAAEGIGDVVETVGDSAEAIGDTMKVVGSGAEVVSDTAEGIGDMVEAAGNGAEAIGDLGSAVGKTTGSFKKFMKTPIGVASAIGIAIAAIGLLYNAYKKAKEAAAEARREAIGTADTFLDSASSFEQAYIKYSGRTNLTSDEEAELKGAIDGTVDALDDKSSALQKVVDGSNDYLLSLEQIKKAELEAANTAAKRKRSEAEKELVESAIGYEKFDGSEVDIELGRSTTEDLASTNEAVKIAKTIGEKYYRLGAYGKDNQGDIFSLILNSDADADEILEYYYTLVEIEEKLLNSGFDDTTQYESVTAAINKMSESIGIYENAVVDAAKASYQLRNDIPQTTDDYFDMRRAILKSEDVNVLSTEAKQSIADALDTEYASVFDLTSAEAQAKKFIGVIKNYGDGTVDGTDEVGTVETFLNMRTAVNDNECSVGDYLSQLDNVNAMTEGWSDDEKKVFNTSFGIDTDTIKSQYDDILAYYKRNSFDDATGTYGEPPSEFKKFIRGLSASELAANVSLINSNDADFNKVFQNYKKVLDEAQQYGTEFSKTTYGNINTNARKTIEWTSKNLEKYKDELMSWEPKDASWDKVKKEFENTTSTVMGTFKTFDIGDDKKVPIAFSPMLQTDKGAEILSSGTVDNYIGQLIEKATKDGKWDKAELISLDTEGIEVDGKKIKGILADVGVTAETTAQQMHFVGKDGALALAAEEFAALLEHQAKIDEALNFSVSIEVDKTALETLNEALAESASAMGLSEEAIDSLESKYKDLDSYDSAKLFERTANGVKLNRQEVAKLEKEQNDLTKSKVRQHLDTLAGEYNRVTEEIDKCSNASERAKLFSEREGYAAQIEELATYEAQLEGVTGAYQRWLNAQETPEDYEGYAAVATSREDIKDEIDRGFISNATKEYIDLLSGKELEGGTIDDYANAWDKLGKKVTGAGYSINDFFTVNDDGDITATGIDRFFKSLQTDFKGSVANFDKETKKWTYDFGSENLEKIKEKYSIGIEAIELLLEAAKSAGYEIDWGSILDGIDLDTSSFETLVSAAEAAQTAYNKIDGLEDVNFNFTATGVEEAESEIEKARQAFSKFINEDGTVNLKADGAEEMQFILTTLIVQKQQLNTPAIMKVDTSQIDEAKSDVTEVINAAKNLQSAYENYEIAISTGVDVENAKKELNSAIDGMKGASVDVRADLKLPTDEELEAAKSSVGDIKIGATLDETAVGVIASKIQTECTPEIIAKVTGIDESAITNGEGGRQIKYTPEHSEVDAYVNGLQDINKKIVFTYTTEGTKPNPKNINKTITYTYKVEGDVPEAYGTAHAGGTASGRAFARGNWGIKGSGTALGGELGQELVVRDGKFFTVGDKGAEFFHYKPNDIIFNAAQTESLFKYGGIRGAKPRGVMLASGTAFAEGKAFAWSATGNTSSFANRRQNNTSNWNANAKESDFAKKHNSDLSNKSSSKSKKEEKEFEETIDWIETAISRIERAIDNLDQKASNIYKSWGERNKSLSEQIGKVREEINLQESAAQRYFKEANSVGLSESWAAKVRNGQVDISTITDEDLADKIGQYQDWYEKYLDCIDAAEELKETEASLYQQRFENVQTQYDGILQGYEHTETMLNEYISQAEAKGQIVSKNYYNALIENEKQNINTLRQEQASLIAERDEAVDAGKIKKGSEAWYDMCAEIDGVTQAIEEGETALIEYGNAMRDIDWEVFDLIQQRISDITAESDFLIELMSNKKLYDDNGRLTEQGVATMGLHGLNYNTYMYQADEYAKQIAELDKKLAQEYDEADEEHRRELIESRYDAILAAENEKNAIRDMVEEGINLELDALQELIDKKNEALESERDLYEYQKKVKEQTEEIASLEKEMAAYEGDNSEEARAKIQELKVSLEDAKTELEETEWDRVIEGTQQILDELYEQYSELLNTRLDDIDGLLKEVIDGINAAASEDGTLTSALGAEGALALAVGANATTIGETLTKEAGNVGATLSKAMNDIWNSGEGNAKSVLTMYGEGFQAKQTTTNETLGNIKVEVSKLVSASNKEAEKKIEEPKTQPSAKADPTKPVTATKPATSNTNKSSAGDGTPKEGDKVKFVSGQYYYDSYGTKPLGSKYQGKEVYITNINKKGSHPYHISTGNKLGKGDLGWLKLNQISGYATGKKDFLGDEYAWTQENGKEFIVRPSDGAILTPIAKGDSVLTSAASNNIWNMANSPAEFIKDNLNLGTANVPNNSTAQSYVQHFENVTFSMPNVHSYNELLAEMQRDPKFEKLILAMSIDRLAGKSSLAKGKSLR